MYVLRLILVCELRWFINPQDREEVLTVSDTESSIASDSPSTAQDSDHKDIIKLVPVRMYLS